MFDEKLFCSVAGLVSDDRKLLNEFRKNPLKYFRFMMGLEEGIEHDSENIVKQIAYRYFTIDRPDHPNQLDKLGEVRSKQQLANRSNKFFTP